MNIIIFTVTINNSGVHQVCKVEFYLSRNSFLFSFFFFFKPVRAYKKKRKEMYV